MLSLIAAAMLAQPWTLASEYETLTLTTGAAHATTYLVSYTENGTAKTAAGTVTSATSTVMLTGAPKPPGNSTRLRIVTAVRIVNTTDQDQTVSIQLVSGGATTTPLPTTLLSDYAVATLPVTGISVLQDEGVAVTARTTVNFTGSGVACADNPGSGRTDCTVTSGGSGGGPPLDAGYVTWGVNPTGSTNERVLANGDNTTIDTGTAGVLKVNVSGTLPQARGGTGAGSLTCSAGQALTSNGTAQACTSTLTASDVACSGTCVSDAEIAALDGAKITSGVVDVAYGGTGLTSAGDDEVMLGNGVSWAPEVLPSCSNATTSKLLYDTATNAFSCGTDQTGGGGGTSPLITTFGSF